MADQLQLRGGTTNEHSTFTGALREVTVDTDKDTLIVHDAATAGGHPLLREDGSNSALSLGTAGTPSLKFTGDTNTGIYSLGADQVAISTGGSGRLFVDANGNVGVGVSNPGDYDSGSDDFVVGRSGNAGITIAAGTSSFSRLQFADGTGASTYRGFVMYSHTDDDMRLGTAGAERLRIDSSGRLLVGRTSSPGGGAQYSRICIQGYTGLDSGAGDFSLMRGETAADMSNGDDIGYIKFTDNSGNRFAYIAALVDGTPSASDFPASLSFRTNPGGATVSPTERMKISANGNVAVDTNTFFVDAVNDRVGVGTSSPEQALEVIGNIYLRSSEAASTGKTQRLYGGAYADNPMTMVYSNNDASFNRLYLGGGTSGGEPASHIYFYTGTVGTKAAGTARMIINPDGNVGVGTTSPSAPLDVATGWIQTAQNYGISLGTYGPAGSSSNASYLKTSSTSVELSATDSLLIRTNGGIERARIDNQGRVGIGTSSPTGKLDVRGSATDFDGLRVLNTNSGSGTQTSAAIRLGITNSFGAVNGIRNCRIQATESDTDSNAVHLDFYTNSAVGLDQETVKMRLTSGGRVGIGTTSPGSTLEVNGDVGIARTSGGYTFRETVGGNERAGIHSSGSNELIFNTAAASEAARIDNSGRLLVGTSSSRSVAGDQSTVQIEGISGADSAISLTRNVNANTGPYLYFGKSRGATVGANTIVNNGDSLGRIRWAGADGTDANSMAGEINCEVDGTPGSNDMPGRLVFSTTADGASSPTERMRISNEGIIYHTSENHGNTTHVTASAGTVKYIFRGIHSATAGSYATGTIALTIWSNGDVENVNNSYTGISDIKLKENIVDASSQWDDLKAIQVRNYNFKEETGHETHTQLGVIAQEIELVSPGLVSESPDLDEDGNDLGTVTKSVNYSVLYMKAVKALQEAMERIETLEAKVSALEAN